MEIEARSQLEVIGAQLDALVYPKVLNGGLVVPSMPSASFLTLGREKSNERKTAKPAASAGASEARWQQARAGTRAPVSGASQFEGGRTPSSASPFSLRKADDELYPNLSDVGIAYPGAEIHRQAEGFWLRLESLLLPGFGRKAVFVVAVLPRLRQVSGWGYWYGGCFGVSWIGPRHTNYPDGSICAYDAMDGTWKYGDNLITLLDIYSVWSVRQLHLGLFGRWPGPQASNSPVERLSEFMDNEWCGCSVPRGVYESCCKPLDLAKVTVRDTLSFRVFAHGRHRHPPSDITSFAATGDNPPQLQLRLVPA